MKAAAETCESCGSTLDESKLPFGSLCPVCALRATCTPDPAATDVLTTWAEVFPQLEVERTLRERDGWSAYLARVPGDDRNRRAVLQVASKKVLMEAGGATGLGARVRRFLAADLDGVASILDSGDLADAFFLITEAPGFPTLAEALTGTAAADLPDLVRAAARRTEEIAAQARGRGLLVSLDPDLCFVDEETWEVVLTPSLLPGHQATELEGPAHWELRESSLLGPFCLESRIGEGGFGEVWQARQDHPVKRIVAIKVLKASLHSQRARARFEIEQQALSRLDHPHIARFFDGGTTPDGRPYFAMEWIDGRSLTHCVHESGLALAQRLGLFRQVCEAVHHAHQKGIIHRDLKSSNVMVTRAGGKAAAKVIDFGIARALEGPLTDQTQLTRAEEILGTPAAMSPEQAAGAGGADLDARTDVYGLGVLLYELLTGTLPFDPKLPVDELRRRIREDDPPKPSSRIENSSRARQMRGDLDWITRRCLEKDPERRYRSVSALLRDLERHESHEPVDAGPPDLGYRLKKFARRNRAVVAGSLVALVALVAGLVLALDGYRRADARAVEAASARERAEREAVIAGNVTGFLKTHFFGQLNPGSSPTRELSLEAAVLRAAIALDGQPLDPRVEGEIRLTLGESFQQLALHEEAERHYRLAKEQLGEAHGTGALVAIEAAAGQARMLSKLGRHGEACPLQRDVVESLATYRDVSPTRKLQSRRNLARALIAAHRLRDGVKVLEEVFNNQREQYGLDHPETLESLAELSRFYGSVEKDFQRAHEFHEDLNPELIYRDGSLETIQALHRVDEYHPGSGRLDHLESRIDEMAECPDHNELELLLLKLELADGLRVIGAHKKNGPILEEISPRLEDHLGADHPSVVKAQRMRLHALYYRGRRDEIPQFAAPIMARIRASDRYQPEHQRFVRDYAIMLTDWSEAVRYFDQWIDRLGLISLHKGVFATVATGDHAAYRRFRDEILQRYGDTSDPYAATTIAECLLIEPLFDGGNAQADLEQAARCVELASQQLPERGKTKVVEARLAYQQGDWEKALALINDIREQDQSGIDLFDGQWLNLIRASCEVRLGNRSEGEDLMSQIEKHWQNRIALHQRVNYGFLLLPVAAAIDEVELEIRGARPVPSRLSPEGFGLGPGRYWSIMARRRARDDEWDAAAESWDKAVAAMRRTYRPDDPRLWRAEKAMADAYYTRGCLADTIAILKPLAARVENHPPGDGLAALRVSIFRRLAAAYRWAGLVEEAIQQAGRALEVSKKVLGPADVETLRTESVLAICLWQGERWEETIPLLKNLVQKREEIEKWVPGRSHRFENHLGMALRDSGNTQAAVEHWRELATSRQSSLDSDDVHTFYAKLMLGEALSLDHRHDAAIKHLNELLRQEKDRENGEIAGEENSFDRIGPVMATLTEAHRRAGREADYQRMREALRTRETAQLHGEYEAALQTAGESAGILVDIGARWQWARPEGAPSDLYREFAQPGFDDSSWSEGADSLPGGFFVEEHPLFEGIDLDQGEAEWSHRPVLFRHRFTTDRPFDWLELHACYNDGLVVFVDGEEVARANVSELPLSEDLRAMDAHAGGPEAIALSGRLEAGEHVLAISLHEHADPFKTLSLSGIRLVGLPDPRTDEEAGSAGK